MRKIVKLFQYYHLRAFILIFRFIYFVIYQKINPNGFLLTQIYDYKMKIPLKYDGIGRALYV